MTRHPTPPECHANLRPPTDIGQQKRPAPNQRQYDNMVDKRTTEHCSRRGSASRRDQGLMGDQRGLSTQIKARPLRRHQNQAGLGCPTAGSRTWNKRHNHDNRANRVTRWPDQSGQPVYRPAGAINAPACQPRQTGPGGGTCTAKIIVQQLIRQRRPEALKATASSIGRRPA